MSWFKAQRRVVLAVAILAAGGTLSACSGLTPVYGERSQTAIALRQAAPATPTDQIIYQALALSFPLSQSAADPQLRITTTASERKLTQSNVSRPTKQMEMVVTADVELVDASGKVARSFSRSAAASFETDSQGFASAESRREATERAAKAVAETIRLSLLALLPGLAR